MKDILDVTVILPIKSSLPRDFDEYFERAMQSLKPKTGYKELIIVASQEEQLKIIYLNIILKKFHTEF